MAQPAMEQINYIGKNLTKQVFAGSKCLVKSRKGVVKFPPPHRLSGSFSGMIGKIDGSIFGSFWLGYAFCVLPVSVVRGSYLTEAPW